MKRIFLSILLLSPLLLVGQSPFSFNQPVVIDKDNGLPSNQIHSLVQDHDGFLWIGTWDGLVRYDGHQMKVFQHQQQDSTSLPNNRIDALCVDHQNRLWVGSVAGISYFAPYSETFKRFAPLETLIPTSGVAGRVFSIYEDDQHDLWIGTASRLFRYHRQQDSVSVYEFQVQSEDQANKFDHKRAKSVQSITQDKTRKDIMWLGTLAGLIKLDRRQGNYRWFTNSTIATNRRYLANSTRILNSLPNGKLLLGSWSGTFLFDPEQVQYVEILPDNEGVQPMRPSATISFLDVPEHSQIGITTSVGFFWFDPISEEIGSVFPIESGRKLTYTAQLIDQQQRVWGKSSNGLYLYNP